ncbi:hypothetical protein WJX81_006877 [Elliptochloris bilobata]|uniref:Alpha-1,3-mannosyltransferase n=1 Tax=Elliptochloris bilobata TaxID=381761 RepID=A0AAW1S1P8_9CHLO
MYAESVAGRQLTLSDAPGGAPGSPAGAPQRMARLLRGRSQGWLVSPRELSRRAELIALASLAVVLLWGLCLLPLPAERHAAPAAHDGRSLLRRSLLGRLLTPHLQRPGGPRREQDGPDGRQPRPLSPDEHPWRPAGWRAEKSAAALAVGETLTMGGAQSDVRAKDLKTLAMQPKSPGLPDGVWEEATDPAAKAAAAAEAALATEAAQAIRALAARAGGGSVPPARTAPPGGALRRRFAEWKARNDPDHDADLEMGEEDLAPPPEALSFTFEEPELLDADMLDMLAYPEFKDPPALTPPPTTEDVMSLDPDTMDEDSFREGLELLEQLEKFRSAGATDKKIAAQREEHRQMERRTRYEAAEYRREVRKRKLQVYEQYLERRAMLRDFADMAAFMASDAWAATYSERLAKMQSGAPKRGIVIPSGGTVLLNHAYSTIKVLREELDCQLPVEVIYNGPLEMTPEVLSRFETDFENVRCLDGRDTPYPAHHRLLNLSSADDLAAGATRETEKGMSGFSFKVFALAYVTTFDEVLLLDADNQPLRNPEPLFEATPFRYTGGLFWPDWWEAVPWIKASAYELFGLSAPWDLPSGEVDADFRTSESGQMLFNRNWHADVLEWLWFLNSHPDVVYKNMYGDKDTFRLAFHLAGKPSAFWQVPTPPRSALDHSPTNDKPVSYLHVGMVQHDPAGRIAFLHRTAEGKFHPFVRDFRHVHVLTVPLSPARAAATLGNRQRHMGFESLQIDERTFQKCHASDEREFLVACGINTSLETFPIPVMPLSALPHVERIINASQAALTDLQRQYNRVITLG